MAGPADLLPWIYSQGNQTRNRLKQLLTDPRAFAGQLEQDAATVMDDSSADSYLQMAQRDPKFAAKVYPTEAQSDPSLMQRRSTAHKNRLQEAVMGGMTVYHGSPHKFDKFDMSKIGTGEGAQSYGHGLYFAENPAVAGQYAKDLASMRTGGANRALAGAGGDTTAAITKLQGEIGALRNLPNAGNDAAKRDRFIALKQEKIDELQKVAAGQQMSAPNLYKVDLPDEHIAKMLDWDKPLSGQPELKALVDKVAAERAAKDKYRPLQVSDIKQDQQGNPVASMSGAAAHQFLASKRYGMTDQQVAQMLREAGIPGIRYADQGSRGTGGGTSNFVVFDDQLPKIVERK